MAQSQPQIQKIKSNQQHKSKQKGSWRGQAPSMLCEVEVLNSGSPEIPAQPCALCWPQPMSELKPGVPHYVSGQPIFPLFPSEQVLGPGPCCTSAHSRYPAPSSLYLGEIPQTCSTLEGGCGSEEKPVPQPAPCIPFADPGTCSCLPNQGNSST